jgi:ABC-type nickel/cobalt efflux system permease component RcnA
MTWSEIISLILITVLTLWIIFDGVVIYSQRKYIGRLEHDNDKLVEAIAPLHPSHPAFRTVDQVLMDMVDCKTCNGLRHPNHFVYHPTHVHN